MPRSRISPEQNEEKHIAMKRFTTLLLTAALVAALAACNRNGVITVQPEPVITLDSPDGIYTVKAGRGITIAPTVENGDGAAFEWILDGTTVGTDPTYTFTMQQAGTYYLLLRVTNSTGSDEEEMRIEVLELLPPVITFPEAVEGVITVATGEPAVITPSVANAEGATYAWSLDGTAAGSDPTFTFTGEGTGDHSLTLAVENEDGRDEASVTLRVVEYAPLAVAFPAPSTRFGEAGVRTVAAGRTTCLRPVTGTASDKSYEWSLDGAPVAADVLTAGGAIFPFTPDAQGEYSVSVTVTDTSGARGSASVKVVCCAEEGTYRRPATAASIATPDRVYEYTAAPGQFINEPRSGFDGVTTAAAAAEYAAARLEKGLYVSLGAWGGYIVAGFDHSIASAEGAEFSVSGNMFDSSSEPGIVWVMQDTNGNGLPDDEWYELKGSEYGKAETLGDYAVTYYRPSGSGMSVRWTDNRGGEGEVPYIPFHKHDTYYPQWIEADSYTLYGVRLSPNTHTDPVTGNIINGAYDWGYADNRGSDCETGDNAEAAAAKCYFDIANAVGADGTPANLQYIDFVKVQTAINFSTRLLGEISTEVLGMADETLK